MRTNPEESVTSHSRMRFPAFITLAATLTRCNRCDGQPVLASVIDGLERKLDPLPLSLAGLGDAARSGRWVGVMSPLSTVVHRAKPGHWWTNGAQPPLLLAEHAHGLALLPHDPNLAGRVLAKFMPTAAHDPNEPPPF